MLSRSRHVTYAFRAWRRAVGTRRVLSSRPRESSVYVVADDCGVRSHRNAPRVAVATTAPARSKTRSPTVSARLGTNVVPNAVSLTHSTPSQARPRANTTGIASCDNHPAGISEMTSNATSDAVTACAATSHQPVLWVKPAAAPTCAVTRTAQRAPSSHCGAGSIRSASAGGATRAKPSASGASAEADQMSAAATIAARAGSPALSPPVTVLRIAR
jgi:hypothetical protein